MLTIPSPEQAHSAYPNQEEMWSMIGHVVTGMLQAMKNAIKAAGMALNNFQCLREPLSATLAREKIPF